MKYTILSLAFLMSVPSFAYSPGDVVTPYGGVLANRSNGQAIALLCEGGTQKVAVAPAQVNNALCSAFGLYLVNQNTTVDEDNVVTTTYTVLKELADNRTLDDVKTITEDLMTNIKAALGNTKSGDPLNHVVKKITNDLFGKNGLYNQGSMGATKIIFKVMAVTATPEFVTADGVRIGAKWVVEMATKYIANPQITRKSHKGLARLALVEYQGSAVTVSPRAFNAITKSFK